MITVAAWIQTVTERAIVAYNRLRHWVGLPLAHYGGRDVVLLHSGHWIDPVEGAEGVARYCLEKHAIVAEIDSGLKRWPWLSVIPLDASGAEVNDIGAGDFFGSLRISRGCELSVEQALLLFVIQKGIMITAPQLRLIDRVGEEKIISNPLVR